MEGSSQVILGKLMMSFDELDRCISSTREILGGKPGISKAVLSKMEQYAEIIVKQREIAGQLSDRIDQGDWISVGRLVRLINGLSAMIREDAQAMLTVATDAGSAAHQHRQVDQSLLC